MLPAAPLVRWGWEVWKRGLAGGLGVATLGQTCRGRQGFLGSQAFLFTLSSASVAPSVNWGGGGPGMEPSSRARTGLSSQAL